MPRPANRFDEESVRTSWDAAADAYAEGQASGRDHYRYGFFGPAHRDVCGDVSGLRVLDLGCGSGYFARLMARGGATVTAVDISPRMIAHAERMEAEDPLGIAYHVGNAARLGALGESGTFDLVTSCMALQDMPDIPDVVQEIARVLRPGGRCVVSITHPCSDTPFREWRKDAEGRKLWLCIDRYFDRGALEFAWAGWAYPFTTPGYHATLQDWFEWFRGAGLRVTQLLEPEPSAEALERNPDLEDAARVPYYLLLDLTHP